MVWQFKFVMQVMISTYIGRYKYLKKSNSGKMLRQSFSSQDQEWRTFVEMNDSLPPELNAQTNDAQLATAKIHDQTMSGLEI